MKLVKCKSKNDCWKSGNVLPKVKRKVEGSFFPGKFSSKSSFWTRTTQIGEDCLNVYVRSVKVFCPKRKKNKKNDKLIFFPKKTFVVKQCSGMVKWCFCHSYQKKTSFKIWYAQNPQKVDENILKTRWHGFKAVVRKLTQPICLKCENLTYKNVKKNKL